MTGEGPEIRDREGWAALLPNGQDVATVTYVEQYYRRNERCHVEAGA